MPSYLIIFWADFGWFSWTSPLLHYIGWHWSKKIGFLIKLIGNFIRQLCHSQIVASTILNLHFLGNNVNNRLKFSSLSTTSLSQDFGSFIWGIYIPPPPHYGLSYIIKMEKNSLTTLYLKSHNKKYLASFLTSHSIIPIFKKTVKIIKNG